MKGTEIGLSMQPLGMTMLGPMLVLGEAQMKLWAVVSLGHLWSLFYW